MIPERSFLTAEWRNLVMLNYEIDPAILVARVPAGCELDSWADHTYVSMVGFQFLDTRVQVEHPRWRVWRADSASLDCDVAALYGSEFREVLASSASTAFVADGSPVVVRRGRRLR